MTDSAPSHILRTAGDWPNWRIYLMAKLAAKQCDNAVDPFPAKPSSALTAAETSEIETAQAATDLQPIKRKAYGYLMPSIDHSLWPIIAAGEMNPRTIIQTLYDHFFLNTSSNLVALTSEFNRLSLHEGESTAQFAGRIDTIANTMSALGGKLQDHQLTARFLDGLVTSHPGWDTFQQILDSRASQGEEATYAKVKLSAATYETSLRRRNDNHAFTANTPAPKLHCGRCGKDGHISDKCWDTECIKPPANSRDGSRSRLPPSACTCGEMHWRSDCPQRQGRNQAYIAQQPAATFVLDTGATCHIVNRRELLSNAQPCNSFITGIGGNKAAITATGTLKDFPGVCNLVPGAQENIISIRQLTNNSWTANFANGAALLESPQGRKVASALQHGDLYRIDHTCFIATDDERGTADMYHWHCTFGHIKDVTRLRNTAATYKLDTANWPKELPHCTACIEGSSTRAPISRKTTYSDRATYKPGQRLHADLVGPLENGDYAVDVTDEATRYEMTEFVATKAQAAAAMARLIDGNYTRHQVDPEEIHSDRGGEFMGSDWTSLCRERRILATYTAAGTPEHNGIAERTHGVSINMARAMLAAAQLDPKKFGRQAFQHAVFLRNIATTRALGDKTPFELWHGTSPRIDNLLPFGARVFYHTTANSKFGKRAAPGLYMGPAHNTTGCAIRVHSLETGRELVTRSFKQDLPGLQPTVITAPQPAIITTPPPTSHAEPDSESDDEGIASDRTPAEPTPPAAERRPTVTFDLPTPPTPERQTPTAPAPRGRELKGLGNIQAKGYDNMPTSRTRGSKGATSTAQGEHAHIAIETATIAGQVLLSASQYDDASPLTYKQAMDEPDAAAWTSAFQGELIPLFQKGVFDILPTSELPPRQRPIRSRWVVTRKPDEHNNPGTRKARLVACGYSQVQGVDFFDISSPVASKESIRTLLAIAAQKGSFMLQYDFEKAYINADIDTEIYMQTPDGFAELLGSHLTPEQVTLLNSGSAVLKLNKALYGLKQSGLLWFIELRDFFISIGFQQCESDPCVFFDSHGNFTFIHVDDGILFSDTEATANAILDIIKRRYSVKCLGQPKSVLGLSVERRSNGDIFVHQRNYNQRMGKTYTADAPAKATPMVSGAALNPDSPPGDKQLYAEMIGTLLFASVSTRPDIACAVSMESRFMQEPSKAHVAFARNTISYTAATADYGLLFRPAPELKIEVHCDASFAGDEHQRRSRSGYFTAINGTPVSWKSGLQPIIAYSTAEAEYIAMSDAVRDAMCIRRLLQELGHPTGVITVFEDNTTAKIIAEEVTTKRSKYIELRYHDIRRHVASGAVKIEYCRSADQLADILTKALPKDLYCKLRDRFMVKGEC